MQKGQGQDVILIHGAAVNLHEMLAGPADALAASYRVTVFDRPGHGHSDPDLKRASAVDQARKIRAAAHELGLERPVIVGHSLGGSVALAYGGEFPDETSGVVLLAPLSNPVWGIGHVGPGLHVVPGLGLLLSRSLFALSDPPLMHAATRMIFAPQKPTPRFLKEFPAAMSGLPLAMRADGADFIATTAALHRMRAGFESYPTPAHILVGSEDKVLKPSRHGERLAGMLAGAKLTVLPGLGHMLHHFAPEAVLTAIAEVVERRLTPAEAAHANTESEIVRTATLVS